MPGLASQQHQASPTSQRVLQGRLQHPHLRLPPYEYSVSKAIRLGASQQTWRHTHHKKWRLDDWSARSVHSAW